MKPREAGFTLIELLIVVAVAGFVLAAASTFFVMSVKQYKVQSKIVETNVEGVLGLELLRRDLDNIGFGLPWNSLSSYTETTAGALSALNDSPSNPPRAVVSIDCAAFTVNRSDYLVIKSASVGRGDAAGKWTTLTQSNSKRSWLPADENLAAGDYVIVLALGNSDTNRRSLVNPGAPYTQFNNTTGFVPVEPYSANVIYGIDNVQPVRPFNRAEYYVADAASNPSIAVPQRCATNTGVLVKAVVAHDPNGTTPTLLPLLDCVADMQVVFGFDTNADGFVDSWRTFVPVAGATAAGDIRTQLKEVRVSILAQEGMLDNTYTHPVNPIYVGMADAGGGNNFDITGFTHYRWKVYHLVINPRNLAQ
jgi:prepilin-type N-terminal cleavage/methylation domain-containing protein